MSLLDPLPDLPDFPDAPLPAPAPDVQGALASVVRRLALTVGLPGRPQSRAREITVAPADLRALSVGLEPLAGGPRRSARARARTRAAVAGTPVVSAPVSAPVPVEPDLAAALGGAPVTIEARLVLQGVDEPLGAGEARIVPATAGLDFEALAAPRFVEAGARGQIDARTRRIAVQARVRASATVDDATHRTPEILVPAEPVELSLLPVELPTLLALFRHRRFAARLAPAGAVAEAGFALVLVPPGSAVPERADALGDILPDALVDLARTLRRLPALGPAMDRLLRAVELLAPANLVIKVRHAPQSNLNRIEMIDQGGLRNDTEADNQVSSLFLLGRPGTVADLFCARDLRPADGHLRVTLDADGRLPVALAELGSLPATPAVRSAGVTVSVVRPSRERIKGGGRVFADAISSVQLAAPESRGAAGPPR